MLRQDRSEQEISQLLTKCGFTSEQANPINLSETAPLIDVSTTTNPDESINLANADNLFKIKVKTLSEQQRQLVKTGPFKIRFVVNTQLEASDEAGHSTHWAVLELHINSNNKVTGGTWIDSNDAKTVNSALENYKDKIKEGLGSLLADSENFIFTRDTGVIAQDNDYSCGLHAVMNMVNKTDTNQPDVNDTSLRAKLKRIAMPSTDTTKSTSEQLQDIWTLFNTDRPLIPVPDDLPEFGGEDNTSVTSTQETDDNDSNDSDENRDNIGNSGTNKSLLEQQYSQDKIQSLNRALLASISQYTELKLSNHGDASRLGMLSRSINAINTQLDEARTFLDNFRREHLNEIKSDAQRKLLDHKIASRLHLIKSAMDRVSIYHNAQNTDDGLLHASIMSTSKHDECTSYQSALEKARELLESPTTESPSSLSNSDVTLQLTNKNIKHTVFKMTVTAQDGTVIHSATIRSVDDEKGSVRSEFHFPQGTFDSYKDKERVNSNIMELVAQNVKNHRATLNTMQINKPMKLEVGNPPMPESMILAYIVYCAFKGVDLEVPVDHREYQRNIDKTGWFNKESKVDNFEKAWKISHPDDVGIKEQQRIDAEFTPRPKP